VGMFETNSSSTHSLIIDKENYSGTDYRPGIQIVPGNFGWEFKSFNDFATKASYMWTLAAYHDNDQIREILTELSETYKFELVEIPEDAEQCIYFYVDHGSHHYEKMLRDYHELDTPAGMWEFLTSPAYWIALGNDNHEGPPGFRMTPAQQAKHLYFIQCVELPGMTPLYITEEEFNDAEWHFLCFRHIDYLYELYEVEKLEELKPYFDIQLEYDGQYCYLREERNNLIYNPDGSVTVSFHYETYGRNGNDPDAPAGYRQIGEKRKLTFRKVHKFESEPDTNSQYIL
jgi:hypothetical protein